MSTVDRHGAQQLYRRQLPGGGFVAIEVTAIRTLLGQRKYHGEIIVEQRAELERREGHAAPTVAVAEGDSVASVLHELFPLAHSNSLVANQVLKRRRESQIR